jgi:hypothetical protein
MSELDNVRDYFLRCEPVGSRVTCSPPPDGSDEDYLVLFSPSVRIHEVMVTRGWDVDGSRIPDDTNYTRPEDRFLSYRRGDVNVILTCSATFFNRFMAASSVAKRLNLLDKADRIALFRAVLYAEGCDEALVKPSDDEVAF